MQVWRRCWTVAPTCEGQKGHSSFLLRKGTRNDQNLGGLEVFLTGDLRRGCLYLALEDARNVFAHETFRTHS
eukprot:s1339_g20.t1